MDCKKNAREERKMILKSFRHCKTAAHTLWNYRSRPSRWQLLALVRTSCAFTALYRSIMATKILQEAPKLQDDCTSLAPYLHDVTSLTPTPAMLAISPKIFNSALDCCRRRSINYRSYRLAGPVELHDNRKKLRENPPKRSSCKHIVGHLWPRHDESLGEAEKCVLYTCDTLDKILNEFIDIGEMTSIKRPAITVKQIWYFVDVLA